MFHVELRRFPHVARAFNLSSHELDERILLPFARGASVELDDRRWAAEKTRLTIYEGPAVAPEDRGMGRGWSLVTRDGEDVTATRLEAARGSVRDASAEGALPGLKQELLAAVRTEPIALSAVVALAEHRLPGRRASQSLALAEQAVWELLHAGELTLRRGDEAVAAEQWESALLTWEPWRDPGALRVHATTSAISRSRSASEANR